jgi:hypothetical protein
MAPTQDAAIDADVMAVRRSAVGANSARRLRQRGVCVPGNERVISAELCIVPPRSQLADCGRVPRASEPRHDGPALPRARIRVGAFSSSTAGDCP